MAGFGDGRFCVDGFDMNLASVAIKTVPHLIYFIKMFYNFLYFQCNFAKTIDSDTRNFKAVYYNKVHMLMFYNNRKLMVPPRVLWNLAVCLFIYISFNDALSVTQTT